MIESSTAAVFCEGTSTEIAAIYEQIYMTSRPQLTHKLRTRLVELCLTLMAVDRAAFVKIYRQWNDEWLWADGWSKLLRTD